MSRRQRPPSGCELEHRSAAARAIPEKSIAVLPFENLSCDKDNAFFADGMQDQILTDLAKIGRIEGHSRTSTEEVSPAGREQLRKIGARAGRGARPRRQRANAGEKVRVNVQLIDARKRRHLWAETYDREVEEHLRCRRRSGGRNRRTTECQAHRRRSRKPVAQKANRQLLLRTRLICVEQPRQVSTEGFMTTRQCA